MTELTDLITEERSQRSKRRARGAGPKGEPGPSKIEVRYLGWLRSSVSKSVSSMASVLHLRSLGHLASTKPIPSNRGTQALTSTSPAMNLSS